MCLVIGYVSYRIGKDVIGVKLAESGTPIRELDARTLGPSHSSTDSSSRLDDTFGSPPPLRPIIEVEPLEDTLAAQYEGVETGTAALDEAAEDMDELEVTSENTDQAEVKPEASGTAEPEPSQDESAAAPPSMEPTRSVPGAKRFRVRVGSYTNEETLVGQMARLRELGYRPWVEEYQRDGVVYKRLFVAEAATYAEAARVQDGLLEQNIDSLVVEE